MQEKIVNSLKEHGLKATPQRVTILSSIDKKGHANIDEIFNDAKVSHPTMSLATVYKNVTSLVEMHLLKELALTNEKSKYEIAKSPHSHLICTKCGYVEDIMFSDPLAENCDRLANSNSFKLEEFELNIYGICKSCLGE